MDSVRLRRIGFIVQGTGYLVHGASESIFRLAIAPDQIRCHSDTVQDHCSWGGNDSYHPVRYSYNMGELNMTRVRHGLSIGIERVDNNFFLSLKAVGKLTHADYQVINPMIDAALEGIKGPKIKVFFDGSEFEGWELRAAWDDLKLGLKHGAEFDKIAIFGTKKWQEKLAKIGSWFISGEIRYFDDANEALGWILQ